MQASRPLIASAPHAGLSARQRRQGCRRVSVIVALLLLSPLLEPAGAQDLPLMTLPTPDKPVQSMVPEWSLDRELDRDRYILGPGDRLLLVLEGKKLRRVPLTILPEGVINWEGGLHQAVGGLSLRAAEERVIQTLSSWMPEVAIKLFLLEPRQVDIHVLGQVLRPGIVRLRATDRLSKAVEEAGGPNDRGSRRFVDLIAAGGEKTRLDLYPYRIFGDLDANPYCPAGQVILVPMRTDTIMVVGEVNQPGTYEWRQGETLADFLDYALGFTADALPASVLLERDEREVEIRILDEHDRALPMRPGDVLVVASRRPLLNRVYLEGAGERSGELYLSPGETLGDLVRRIGDMEGSALPEEAILERRGTERDEFFSFNLKAVLQGQGPVDMRIENEDVLYIPIRSRQVYVLGEVESPGSLSYNPAWTVGKYLALAGGTTDRGSDKKMRVIGIDGQARDVNPTDHLHRGDILYVRKSNWAIFSDVMLTAATLSGLILAINALSK